MTRNRAVQRELKGFDLDLNRLSFLHKPNIFILDLRLYFDRMVLRHDNEQLLRWGDDATDGMHR